MSGALLILAYKRPEVLRETVNALMLAEKSGINEVIVVIQGSDEEVLQIVKDITWMKCRIFKTEYSLRTSAKEAINRNLYTDLEIAFNNSRNDYAVVIEDDICVSRDFFNFIYSCYTKYKEDDYFRAINGFSLRPFYTFVATPS